MSSIEILLVEDNPGDIELTKEALEQGKLKNNINVCEDGEEALDYLLRRNQYEDAKRPDLIFMDLNLPKLNGRDVLKTIKEDSDLMSIPVVILSSSEAAKDIQSTYNLHANCFVSKPVQIDDFMRVVQTVEYFWFDIVKLPSKC